MFNKIVIFFLLINFYIACNIEKTPPPPPPQFSFENCDTIKEYCEPTDSAEYKYITCDLYRGKNGSIYQKKYSDSWKCCKQLIFYDSTLGYFEDRRPLDKIIDINTYTCSIDSSCYSKDKNHVYWFADRADGGFLFIVDANVKTFKGLSYCKWGVDNKNVYYRGEKLEDLNPKKIQFLKHSSDKQPTYIKDEKVVYYDDEKVEKADAKTFRLIQYDKQNSNNEDYDAIDKYRKYYLGQPK